MCWQQFQHVFKKIYTKMIKCNWELITSIKNLYLFSDSNQSNVNFEPSFTGILEVLREIWHFEHKFQARNFGQLFEYQICQQTVHKINKFHWHFQLESKRGGRNNEF